MRNVIWAAVAGATALLGALSPAKAAIVEVSWGGFLEGGNGPNGPFFFESFGSHTLPGYEPVNYSVSFEFTTIPVEGTSQPPYCLGAASQKRSNGNLVTPGILHS